MRIRFPSQSRGFAVVEVLVAAAIVGVSMLGLGVGLKKVSQSRDLVRGVTTALGFESGLQTAMLDPTQYTAIQTQLSQGNITTLPDFNLQVHVTSQAGQEQVINLPINHDVSFTADGQPCQNCNDWMFKARVEGVLKSSATMPIYAMAYRLQFNQNLVSLANLGSTHNTNFTSDDFNWMVPIEAYQNSSVQNCQIGSRDVIVTGINKDNMQVNCLKVGDNTQCAPDEIATGWVYETAPGNGGGPLRQLKMGCRKLNSFPTCPSLGPGGYDYVMNGLDPRTSTTSTPQGQCVFIAQASANVSLNTSGSTASRSATFDVCPPYYTFNPAPGTTNGCGVALLKTINGWRDLGCPAGEIGANWIQDVAPSPLTFQGVIQNGGRQVACSLDNDQQMLAGVNNWAGYQARISVQGTCVLSSPEMK